MAKRADVTKVISKAITQALTDKGLDPGQIGETTAVDGRLGLDSLDWAAVVVGLEADLGVDPFAEGVDKELKNVGDLVDLYEAALK